MCSTVKSCGIGGVCDVVNGTNDKICICTSDAWSQSTEWLFFLNDPALAKTLRCDENEKLMKFLYGVGSTTGILALFLNLVLLRHKQWNTWKRFSSTLVGLTTLTFAGFLRVNDIKRYYGQDYVFTILVAICGLCGSLAAENSWNKFIAYVVKNFPFLETVHNAGRMDASMRCHWIIRFLAYASFAIQCTLPAYVFQPEIVLRLVYFDLVMDQLLVGLVQIGLATYLFHYLEQDICSMLAEEKELVRLDEEVKIKLRRLLPKFRYYKQALRGQFLLSVCIVVPLFIFEYSWSLFKYYIPIVGIIGGVSAITIVRKQIRWAMNKNKKFAKIVTVEELME